MNNQNKDFSTYAELGLTSPNDNPAITNPGAVSPQDPWGVGPDVKRNIKSVAKLKSIDEILASIDALSTRIDLLPATHEENKTSTARWDRLKAIGEELGPLLARVQQLRDEESRLKAAPSPDEAFIQDTVQAEHEARMLSGDAMAVFQQQKALALFEMPFLEITADAKENINNSLRPLRQHSGPAASSFGMTDAKSVAGAKSTLLRIKNNLRTVVDYIQAKIK